MKTELSTVQTELPDPETLVLPHKEEHRPLRPKVQSLVDEVEQPEDDQQEPQ